MKKTKLFSTPKRAVITVCSIIAILAVLSVSTVLITRVVAQSSSVGKDNAVNFAFVDAGIDPGSAQLIRSEFDFENGHFVYEVEFIADGIEYEYWIKASDGSVMKKEMDMEIPGGQHSTDSPSITRDEAEELVLADAGLTRNEVTFRKTHLDMDDGVAVYEVEFFTDTQEYEYEIHATSKQIYSKKVENRQAVSDGVRPGDSESQLISLDSATQIALKMAGVQSADVTFTKQQKEYDDGIAIWDVEFYTATHKYEFEINAATGEICSMDIEARRGSNQNSGTVDSSYVDLETARNAALTDAGLTAADVTVTKERFGYEDGVAVYEIDFYTATSEYEYKISAVDGSIRKKDVETFKTQPPTNPDPEQTPAADVGLDAARNAALKDAGLSADQVTFTKQKKGYEDGIAVYEIDFYTATHEYEYEISAETGAIRKKDKEAFATRPDTGNSGNTDNSGNTGTPGSSGGQTGTDQLITLDEAKNIALNDANLTADKVTFTKQEKDYDDRVTVWEIEFFTETHEYEYEINAQTKEIRSRNVEARKISGGQNPGGSTGTDQLIALDEAKNIALNDANLTADKVTFTKQEQDIDDRVTVWEIEFITDTHEYEYEINATTGAIRSRDVEARKQSVAPNQGQSGSYIGIEQAKEKALAHAGLNASQVRFSKAKLEHDDGYTLYEIEFFANGMEYEYKINAQNGAILDYDVEQDD